MCGLPCRPSPRLLCTATKQKNSGQNLEEDVGQSEQKADPPATEKTLLEEKVKLEEQLKETVVRTVRLLWEWAWLNCFSPGPYKGSRLHW